MKRILLVGVVLLAAAGLYAQEIHGALKASLQNTAVAVTQWDTETMLDSLDQEKLPKLVTGGLMAGANMNDFIITRDHHTMTSHTRVGAELGGFLDFTLSKHFAIQPQVLFTFHQNYFAATDSTVADTINGLWSFGMEIPVYFLGRFGNLRQGYFQFGGGIFTHFTFASNTGKYRNVDETAEQVETSDQKKRVYEPLIFREDYSRLYNLHNNHFGLCFTLGYEFAFGMQINAYYKISLSDIAGFYNEMKGKQVADALIYPQSVSLCIGYRWK